MLSILNWIRTALAGAGAAKLGAIGKRIGMATPSVEGVIASIKANPITAALVASELGMGISSIIDYMKDDVPAGQLQQIQLLLAEDDAAPTDDVPITEIGSYADEMAAIKEAVGSFGTLDKLLNLRRVLMMDPKMFNLYVTLRDMRF